MQNLLNTYSKEFLKEIVNMIMINKRIDEERVKQLMMDNKIIGKGTKTLHVYYNTGESYSYSNCQRVEFTYHKIYAKNGRGECKLNIYIKDYELKELIEQLKEE